MTDVVLIDSPFANVANIARALVAAGAKLRVSADPDVVGGAARIVLPGVGAFAPAMGWLTGHGLDVAIRRALSGGASLLGVCVGHQMLFDQSDEMGMTAGLALLRGEVRRLDTPLPVPQIGWNRVHFDENPLFAGIASGTPFYFVNSYAVPDAPAQIARADYGSTMTAAVQSGRVFGVQFHPEKSSTAGLRLLGNFVRWN